MNLKRPTWAGYGRDLSGHSTVLAGILVDHGSQLDDEALSTLMTETENIVNSRTLARVTQVYPSGDGLVQKVELLLTRGGERKSLQRPVHKIVLLYAENEKK